MFGASVVGTICAFGVEWLVAWWLSGRCLGGWYDLCPWGWEEGARVVEWVGALGLVGVGLSGWDGVGLGGRVVCAELL